MRTDQVDQLVGRAYQHLSDEWLANIDEQLAHADDRTDDLMRWLVALDARLGKIEAILTRIAGSAAGAFPGRISGLEYLVAIVIGQDETLLRGLPTIVGYDTESEMSTNPGKRDTVLSVHAEARRIHENG